MPYLRPSATMAKIVNPIMGRLARKSFLVVPGRTTGQPHEVPVNVLELDGSRYLVAVRGETEWVRNVRAAGGGAIRRHGRTEAFRAVDVPVADRPRIIGAYRDKWDREVKKLFEQLPDPGDHPVFRIETRAEE